MTANTPKPWYRNPMVWLVIFFPAVAVVAGLSTVYIAASTSDGLVEDDYYQKGLQINRVIDRDHHARELGVRAALVVDARSGKVEISLRSRQPLPAADNLTLRLLHRTIPGLDQQTEVIAVSGKPGQYQGYLKPPIGEGLWTLLLQSGNNWRLKKSFETRAGQTRITLKMHPPRH